MEQQLSEELLQQITGGCSQCNAEGTQIRYHVAEARDRQIKAENLRAYLQNAQGDHLEDLQRQINNHMIAGNRHLRVVRTLSERINDKHSRE